MINNNPIQKIVLLTSMFNESPSSCSHIKNRHQFALEILVLKHQEAEPCMFLVTFNQKYQIDLLNQYQHT